MANVLGAIGTAVGAYFGGPVGATIGGQLGSNIDSQNSATQAQDFSAAQYASRYQTTTRDMMAAGLNPMLAYGGISGSPPTGVPVQYQNPAANYAQNLATAAQLDNIAATTENIKADTQLKQAQAENTGQQTTTGEAQAELIAAQAALAKLEYNTGYVQAKVALTKAQEAGVSASAALAASQKAGVDIENSGFKKAFNDVYKNSPALARSGVLIEQGAATARGVRDAASAIKPWGR